MKTMRAFAFAVVLACAAACSPPGPQGVHEATQEERTALDAAVATNLAVDLGQPVSLRIDHARVDGDWAWVIAQPSQPGGAPIDWSTTRYAEANNLGMLDGGGTTYTLLQRANGAWTVKDFVVGPTDAPWVEWSTRHGAPASLWEQ
jgi:hypothetical protein